MHKKNIFWLLSIYMLMCAPVSAQVLFEKDCQTEIFVGKEEKEVVHTALEILQKDVKNVFDARLVPASAPGHDIEIVAGTVDNPEMQAYLKRNEVDLPPIMGQWEAFQIRKLGKKQVLVTGSDARGLAYGLLEISRMIGVSPWEWWADVTPDKRDRFLVSERGSTSPFRAVPRYLPQRRRLGTDTVVYKELRTGGSNPISGQRTFQRTSRPENIRQSLRIASSATCQHNLACHARSDHAFLFRRRQSKNGGTLWHSGQHISLRTHDA